MKGDVKMSVSLLIDRKLSCLLRARMQLAARPFGTKLSVLNRSSAFGKSPCKLCIPQCHISQVLNRLYQRFGSFLMPTRNLISA